MSHLAFFCSEGIEGNAFKVLKLLLLTRKGA